MLSKDKLIFDAANDVDNVGSWLRSADGTLLTHTDNAGKKSLDVNLSNASIVVTATDLDIRNLVFADDKVDASGSDVTVSNTVAVSGSDFDIRELSHLQDSIKIGDGVDFLAINADGSINVNADISVVNGSDKAEDAASASGDIGTYMLSVRQDSPASSTSTDGDYQSIKTDALGRMWVNDASIAEKNSNITATTTAGQLTASPLANRRRMYIQNLGSKDVFIGDASVTTTNGFKLSVGGTFNESIGAGVSLYAVTATGTSDLRILEL